MQCKLKSKLDPPPSQSAPRPPTLLFPRELWPLVSAGSHRVWLVVASWLQWATTTCSGIVVGGRPLCPPLAPPTTTHPLKPQAKPRSDLEGRPLPPASGSLVSEWLGPGGLRCRLATSTTHCGAPSLPGRCGRAGRAATLLSVAARCGPAPPIMVATASTRRRRGPRGRHNPPQPHLSAAVESWPPHTAVQPQKSARCSHQR